VKKNFGHGDTEKNREEWPGRVIAVIGARKTALFQQGLRVSVGARKSK